MSILWETPDTSAILTKTNGETIRLYKGLFFKYAGRDTGVRLDGFSSKSTDTRGPIGIFYLPWRESEKRWATYEFTLRGNSRLLIAFPAGRDHYGEQIAWDTLELVNGGVCPDAQG